MRKEFHVPKDHVNTCKSIEEMFAIISVASEVVTDRYHPGVASLIHGIKLTVTRYPAEEIKLKGLFEMGRYNKFQTEEMNEKAFNALLQIIQS